MSVNNYLDHLHILPEDEHDEQLANGFVNHPAVQDARVRVLTPAGGWLHVVNSFESAYVRELRRFPKRRMVLLIDFDEDVRRREYIEARIPEDLKDRVFLIGVWDEPKDLKLALNGKAFEKIGTSLAQDCFLSTGTSWSHPHLAHNKDELARLREQVRPFLFDEA